jgi:hypothetical protein
VPDNKNQKQKQKYQYFQLVKKKSQTKSAILLTSDALFTFANKLSVLCTMIKLAEKEKPPL